MAIKKKKTCPSCDVKIGQYHQARCVLEQCPYCGGRLHRCMAQPNGCSAKPVLWPPPTDDRIRWNGFGPGEQVARQRGWAVRRVGNMMVPCDVDHPDAVADLTRVAVLCQWDRSKKRLVFVRKTETPPAETGNNRQQEPSRRVPSSMQQGAKEYPGHTNCHVNCPRLGGKKKARRKSRWRRWQ